MYILFISYKYLSCCNNFWLYFTDWLLLFYSLSISMSTSREISRKCLKEDYKTVVCAANDEEAFMKQCIKWLENVEVFTCFQLLPFGDIKTGYLRESEKEKKPVKFDELESALKNMEKYAQNLLKKPWCKDFHTIKVMCLVFEKNAF